MFKPLTSPGPVHMAFDFRRLTFHPQPMLLPIFCKCVVNDEFIQALFSEVTFPKPYCCFIHDLSTYPFCVEIEEEYGYGEGTGRGGRGNYNWYVENINRKIN